MDPGSGREAYEVWQTLNLGFNKALMILKSEEYDKETRNKILSIIFKAIRTLLFYKKHNRKANVQDLLNLIDKFRSVLS